MASRRLTLAVRISPGSPVAGATGPAREGCYRIRLRSKPVENRANKELISLLACEFGVPRQSVKILAGVHSRSKVVEIADPSRIPSWFDGDAR